MRRPDVALHIEELVLHGFDPADRHRIADAVQTELTRLIAERGVGGAQPLADAARLSAGTVTLARGARPAAAGTRIARAVHGALRR